MQRVRGGTSILVPVSAALLAGCSAAGYYGQSVWGGLQLLVKRRPIETVIAGRGAPPDLKARLRIALEIRDFASRELALPDNGSYRSYVDLGRPFAVWNVVAAPELSVVPLTWCFPIAGCVAYRGYFSEARAERFAAGLRAEGYDVDVAGVTAFSTLGWFADPVLNTFVDLPEPDLAGLIFHELAHQVAYAKDDTSFNESFATAVEAAGVARWLTRGGRDDLLAGYQTARRREEELVELIFGYRERLAAVYGEERPDAWKRERKREELAALRADYQALKARWGGYRGFDGWFERGFDNADLAAVGAYHTLVPAFEGLLARLDADLPRFYAEVRRIAALPPRERERGFQPP